MTIPDKSGTTDRAYERGHVEWHCSEEDGGPDVGMSLGLGSSALWVGEITKQRAEQVGCEDTGWWLMIYPDGLPLAKFVSADGARDFFDRMEEVVRGR